MEGLTPAPRHRRLGARLLPEVPEPPPRLPRRLVEHGQLGRGQPAVFGLIGRAFRPAAHRPRLRIGRGREALRRSGRSEIRTDPCPRPTRPTRPRRRRRRIFEANLGPGGSVIRGAAITQAQAEARRAGGGDVVVCGPSLSANRSAARAIEYNANGSAKRCPPHPNAGPDALPHYQPDPRPPDGHTFYETEHRKAK